MDSVYLCCLWENKETATLSKYFLTDDTEEQKEQISFLAHSNAQRPKGRRNHRFIVDELTSGQVNELIVDRVIEDKVTGEQSSFE